MHDGDVDGLALGRGDGAGVGSPTLYVGCTVGQMVGVVGEEDGSLEGMLLGEGLGPAVGAVTTSL